MNQSRPQKLAGCIGKEAVEGRSEWAAIGAEALRLDGEIGRIATSFNRLAYQMDSALERQVLQENLIASAADAIISKTLQGIVTSWNPAAEKVFGYSADEMIGQSIRILIPEDLLHEENRILERTGRGERTEIYQTTRRRKNGEVFPISVTVSPIRDSHGKIIGASKIARDITQEVMRQEALKRAEERYQLVLAGMSVGVWDWDLKTDEMVASERFWAMTGLPQRDTIAKRGEFMARVHPDDRQTVLEQIKAHLESREKFDVVYRIGHGSGDDIWLHATGQAVWDADGKPVRMAGSVEDITLRTRLESDLVATVDKLEKSNKDLDEFAYAASHDLKAPLRVIDNTSQWLLEDLEPYLSPESRENMALLRGRVKRMEKLLSDLLEYSRIGRTQDDRYEEVVSGGELLENILEMLSPPAGFSVTPDANFLGLQVMRMPLQQVLMNLVGNAIKHHDKTTGMVKLSVEDDGRMFAFTVEDDGPGVPAQFHDKVFEMFRTLKPRDQVEGSGMGLAMVRKNVERFGGAIKLVSDTGKGTRFCFTWPKLQPAQRAER